MNRKYLVKNTNKVDEGAKFLILIEELKGQTLNNAVMYWSLANKISSDIESKEIQDKINELNELLK